MRFADRDLGNDGCGPGLSAMSTELGQLLQDILDGQDPDRTVWAYRFTESGKSVTADARPRPRPWSADLPVVNPRRLR